MIDVTIDYYDKVLAAIAASLVLGFAVGAGTGVRLYHAVVAGSVVASGFLYAAMFRNPPLPDGSPRTKAAIVLWHAFLAVLVWVGS